MDVSQYLEIFIDESAEHLQTLSDCIMTLEKEPDNKDTINEVFRAAHSLKGMAGTMGFKRMQHLTHDMENVFQEVRSDKIPVDSPMIDLLFKCLDAIDGYLENIKATSDEGTEDNEIIIKELNDFIAKANGQAVSEAPKTQEEEKTAAPESKSGGESENYSDILDEKVGSIKSVVLFLLQMSEDALGIHLQGVEEEFKIERSFHACLVGRDDGLAKHLVVEGVHRFPAKFLF